MKRDEYLTPSLIVFLWNCEALKEVAKLTTNPTIKGTHGFQLTSDEELKIMPPYINQIFTVSPANTKSWTENFLYATAEATKVPKTPEQSANHILTGVAYRI